MRPIKTVKLSKAIVGADGKAVTELQFEEPSAHRYFELGPITTVYTKGDVTTTSDLDGVLMAYARACIRNVDPGLLPDLVAGMPLADGLAIRSAFSDFFAEAFTAFIATTAAAAEAATAQAGA